MSILNDNDSLDKTKDKVIVSNNAHTIFEHLKSLENEPKHRQRWIWELIQNAQDASANEVTISLKDNTVIFSHNGLAFTEEDITHLIFHGSSKPGLEGKTGKFGTGFMTTHLLSKKVRIEGKLTDGKGFDFILTREATGDEDMTISLNESWDNFKKSISAVSKLVTVFTYLELNENIEVVENVIDNLPTLMPYVLVFSGKINKVTIKYKDDDIIYYKDSPININNDITVHCTSKKSNSTNHYRMLLKDLTDVKASIAVPLDSFGNITYLDSNIPRIFITFPLIGTNNAFSFPFLVNSQDFEPSSEREKLWLSANSNTPQTIKNKNILESAFKDYSVFVADIIKEKRNNLHFLADFGEFRAIEWVDGIWYKTEISKLLRKIDSYPLIKVSKVNTENISLIDSYIPFRVPDESKADIELIWKFCNYLFSDRIPTKEHSHFWYKILLGRISFNNDSHHSSSFTVKRICETINSILDNNVANLRLDNIDSYEFTQELVKLLESYSLESYLSEYAILPNQNGVLKKAASLKQELFNTPQEIGEKLKTVAAGFKVYIKDSLLDKRITITSEDYKLQTYEKDSLVESLLTKVKGYSIEELSNEFEKSSIAFFHWLMENKKINHLVGYPIKMQSNKWEYLQSAGERFLIPISLWPDGFDKYSELFPSDYILNEAYSEILLNQDLLNELVQKNFVYPSPLYQDLGKFDTSDLKLMVTTRYDKEKLSKDENKDWEMEEISLSKITFFKTLKDKSVIDKTRGSNKSTKLLLKMIADILLKQDSYGFRRKEIIIKSEEETLTVGIYPCQWLNDLKTREWIKIDGKTASKPSVEALLPYFADESDINFSLYNSLQSPHVSKLLHFFGIGVGDLLRNIRSGDNEEERFNWDQSYVSILMNPSLTPEKVTSLLGDPVFIQAYENKKVMDAITKKNQEIGATVEEEFKKVFEGLDGYKIDREPIGSDYIIECDFNHYLLLGKAEQKKFIIEIKSSRSTEVRMTVAQGNKAYKEKENYILCVIPLDGNENINDVTIIKNARFVTNIASLLKSRVEKIDQLKNNVKIDNVHDANIRTEIDGINIRYAINQKVWLDENALSFADFVKRFT